MILGFFHIFLGSNSVLIEFVVLCGFCCSLMLHDTAYKCLHSRVQLWKEVTIREKSRWLMLMTPLLGQRGLDYRLSIWTPQIPILCCISDSWKLFQRCHTNSWTGYWPTISLWNQHSHMVCHQGLELSSLWHWCYVREHGERILC